MADYDKAADALIEAIATKASDLQGAGWQSSTAAPLLLQLAQAYAAVREVSQK
jgi:hypothetical protein